MGVFALMVLAGVCPPRPSRLVTPFAGSPAAEGTLSLAAVLLEGIAGIATDDMRWHVAGGRMARDRLRRLARRRDVRLTGDAEGVDAAAAWFDRHGGSEVLVSRTVPGARPPISAPAGLAGMAPRRFVLLMALDGAVRVGMLMAAGHALRARYERVGAWLDAVTTTVVMAIGLLHPMRFSQGPRRRAGSTRSAFRGVRRAGLRRRRTIRVGPAPADGRGEPDRRGELDKKVIIFAASAICPKSSLKSDDGAAPMPFAQSKSRHEIVPRIPVRRSGQRRDLSNSSDRRRRSPPGHGHNRPGERRIGLRHGAAEIATARPGMTTAQAPGAVVPAMPMAARDGSATAAGT